MKFLSWMQNKFNGGKGEKRPNAVLAANHAKNEVPKEFSDWPQGLLAIGTFGNSSATNDQEIIPVEENPEIEITPQELECSSPDFSEFTAEEVVKLEKELKKLLNKKSVGANTEKAIANLPLDRFLNCPSSLEMDRSISNRISTYSDEEEIDRTIRIILGRCKDVCEKKRNKIGKKSLAFLAKKMFVCASGFAPAPSLRDPFQESRMEKLMRTMLTKKIYSQNSYRTSSTKKYIEDRMPTSKTEEEEDRSRGGSKWDKTDSEYIVLDI